MSTDQQLSQLPEALQTLAKQFLDLHQAQSTNFEVSKIYKEGGVRKGHRYVYLSWSNEDSAACAKLSTIGDVSLHHCGKGHRSERWDRTVCRSDDFSAYLAMFRVGS